MERVPTNLRRRWAWEQSCGGDNSDANSTDFTLMTYNILADCHVKGWYPYCPRDAYKMADRHRQLIVEISHHDPDIVCLQEVGPVYFAEQLYPAMISLGYAGSHFNKVRGVQEGGATFYKRERFQKVEERGVVFNELVTKACRTANLLPAVQDGIRAYTSQGHLVLLTKLQDDVTKRTISVGNTHLLFDEYRNIDINTLQAGLAMNSLIEFAGGVDCPHVLCGDFNQEPTMTGYQLMRDGKLDTDGERIIREYSVGKGELNKSLIDFLPACFRHPSSSVKSAYKTVVGEEVSFSNYEGWPAHVRLPPNKVNQGPPTKKRREEKYVIHDETYNADQLFIAALDYQWYSSDTLKCKATLEMVREDEIHQFYACPNKDFPSDHLSILSRYGFTRIQE
ncbi:uncharacterized protein [Diadema antillarum]|uniref:uncharacterized protein n=1 Tax=Diadema antillarum TaxID=105358 RepID=UPI003A83C992